ncbi:enoyl-CoA hydratase domain-containing protein 2, mitochondrial isoform X2 [Ahaetulla prasina]|uniref:enoyl-CoA hydratase domain-containing protein 2, mitochondrial isoform X1 n=1 Tax=Ahaetulla prasina TaxID=499056 RepID=UPI0026490E8D|nr:enoyl-CoA hydratase domain-containing protein 2, mitochondrial isoform X1 [Ahaetulla prasina]XP_058033627.1 enoyl-CoA hydratase domain-containing protein 2, mitochondrial isoform X2 [Ahaetulla prasina]
MLRLGQATAVLRLLSAERCLGTVGISPRRPASGDKKKEILLHVHGKADRGIAEIQMNRPHARNALGKVFVDELYEILDVLHFDESIRAVIVKSKVKGVFCAGADLKERARMSDAEADHFVQRLRSLMDNIASSAKMGLIETTRGLLPGAGGTQRLSRYIGIGLAKELIFTGRQIDGQEAFSMGLLNHTVPQNEEGDAAYQKALALAEEIVPQAPIAVRLGKLAINKGIEVDIASGMAIERMCYAQNLPTRDRQEGMAAFNEKRLPKFTGK